MNLGFPGGSEVKASACNVGDLGSIPGSGRFPWRRKWQPTPVFLPGESHGWRNLVGSQESSLAPQFESISSSALSLLYGPTLTSVHDYWKNHSFDYMDLCCQSDVSAF